MSNEFQKQMIDDLLLFGITISHIDGEGIGQRIEPLTNEWWEAIEKAEKETNSINPKELPEAK